MRRRRRRPPPPPFRRRRCRRRRPPPHSACSSSPHPPPPSPPPHPYPSNRSLSPFKRRGLDVQGHLSVLAMLWATDEALAEIHRWAASADYDISAVTPGGRQARNDQNRHVLIHCTMDFATPTSSEIAEPI